MSTTAGARHTPTNGHLDNNPVNHNYKEINDRLWTISGRSLINSKENATAMDPDNVFVRHTISEVKTILYKLRSDIDAKHEELRLMVGERYRDLLHASTSIIAMADSSKRVVGLLAEMELKVNEKNSRVILNEDSSNNKPSDGSLQILQCLAAHLKLLIDASEHLWRLLERSQYLQATWLFLLSRVVYRSLVSHGADERINWEIHGINVTDQFPLAKRQWDTISQFRAQISHRATLSLREKSLSSQGVCGSLLALHFLDSLPLSDALDIFLKQRTRSLENLYDTLQSIQDHSVNEIPSRTAASDVWRPLRAILDALSVTLKIAREVFRETEGSPSLIRQILALSQTNNSNHLTSFMHTELNLTTQSLLASLPNSNVFNSLPQDIKAYKPFVDVQSPSTSVNQSILTSRVNEWFKQATARLHSSASSWFNPLGSMKKVWVTRTSFYDWLLANSHLEMEDRQVLSSMLEDVVKMRIRKIWESALDKLFSDFYDNVNRSLTSISEENENSLQDVSSDRFLLATLPNLTFIQTGLGVPFTEISFQRFKDTVKQRTDGLTPLLKDILMESESAANKIYRDSECVFASDEMRSEIQNSCLAHSEATAERFISSLESIVNNRFSDLDISAKKIVFIGRLIWKLSSSAFTSDIRCSPAYVNSFTIRLYGIYDICKEKWSSSSIRTIEQRLGYTTDFRMSTTTPGPSPQLMNVMLSLVKSIQAWSFYNDYLLRSALAKSLLIQLAAAIVKPTITQQYESTAQYICDVYFVKRICEGWDDLQASVKLLEESIQRSQTALSMSPETDKLLVNIQRSTVQALPNLCYLLSPLLQSSNEVPSLTSPTHHVFGTNRKTSVSTSHAEPETHPVLHLVKQPPRFGSLWVGAS